MMSNPHMKESSYTHYLGEKTCTAINWEDIDDLWVEVGGTALIICTVTTSLRYGSNAGFRLVDENYEPLPPFRTSTNNRRAVHFSTENEASSLEDQMPVTFHMIANCKYAKVQMFSRETDASGAAGINAAKPTTNPTPDVIWNHKTISTMTAIPLMPIYQPGANTIFTYPQTRMPRRVEDDKPPVIHKDKTTSSSP